MITLEQEEVTLTKNRTVQQDEESFSATLKKAIDLSTSKTTDDEQSNKRFYYSTGNNNFLIEQDLKAETLKNMPVNKIPFTPEWYMGIVSIRGVIMPVINMDEFVNTQTKTRKKTTKSTNEHNESYFLKLEHKTHPPIVIRVNKLPEKIDMSQIKKRRAAKTKPGWMLHTMKNGTASITEVDHKGLFNQIKKLS